MPATVLRVRSMALLSMISDFELSCSSCLLGRLCILSSHLVFCNCSSAHIYLFSIFFSNHSLLPPSAGAGSSLGVEFFLVFMSTGFWQVGGGGQTNMCSIVCSFPYLHTVCRFSFYSNFCCLRPVPVRRRLRLDTNHCQ